MNQSKLRMCWISGWGMSSSIWRELASQFAHMSHFYVDFEDCVSVEDYRDTVKKVLQEEGEPWIIVAWSLGGMLALEQIFTFPSGIRSVILFSTTLKFEHHDRSRGWPSRVIERMRKQLQVEPEHTLSQFRGKMLSARELQDFWEEKLRDESIRKYTGLDAGLSYLLSFDLTSDWFAWRARTSKRKLPLLWIHGTDDQICPVTAIPDDLTEDEQMKIPGGGHALMLTHRRDLVSTLERWIDDFR